MMFIERQLVGRLIATLLFSGYIVVLLAQAFGIEHKGMLTTDKLETVAGISSQVTPAVAVFLTATDERKPSAPIDIQPQAECLMQTCVLSLPIDLHDRASVPSDRETFAMSAPRQASGLIRQHITPPPKPVV